MAGVDIYTHTAFCFFQTRHSHDPKTDMEV